MGRRYLLLFAPVLLQNIFLQLCSGQALICKDGGNGHLGPGSCCNEMPYFLGHLNPESVKECMVEPGDASLSFVDSYWEHYVCIINKTLGTQPVTATAYAQLMAKNLPGPIQKELLSLFEANVRDDPALAPIQRLKLFWRGYFDADFIVCGRAARAKGTFKETDRRFWEPSYTCAGEPIPFASMLSAIEFDKFFAELEKCEDRLKAMINNQKESDYWKTPIEDSCEFVVDKEITFEDLMNKTLDYEHLYRIHDTTVIWSKSVREMMFENFKAKLITMGFNSQLEGFPFKGFETRVLKVVPLSKFQEMNEALRQFYINSQALTFMLDVLLEIREKNICRPGPR